MKINVPASNYSLHQESNGGDQV